MKKHISTVIFVLFVIAGLSLMLYPTVSDLVNSIGRRRSISEYEKTVAAMDNDSYESLFADARAFNEELLEKPMALSYTGSQMARYENLLNIFGSGMMGYIDIPAVDIHLPIYHGTGDAVLQKNAGHLEGSSLPIGGESTHSVLSGHRGLPSAKLFTDIDKLREGDIFIITVLKETVTYEVDQILTLLPNESAVRQALKIEEGKDYCTLITCTPYGINTHRLLVRGHRIETPEDIDDIPQSAVGGDQTRAEQVEPLIITAVITVPVLLFAMIYIALNYRKRDKQ